MLRAEGGRQLGRATLRVVNLVSDRLGGSDIFDMLKVHSVSTASPSSQSDSGSLSSQGRLAGESERVLEKS